MPTHQHILACCSPAAWAQTLWENHAPLLTNLCPKLTPDSLTDAFEQAKTLLLENNLAKLQRLADFLFENQYPPQRLWPLLPSLRKHLLEENAPEEEIDAFLLTLSATLQSLFCQIQANKEFGRLAFLGKYFAFLLHEIATPLAIAETSAFRLQHLLLPRGEPPAMDVLAQLQTQLASLRETLHQIRILAWENPKTLQTCPLLPSIEKALSALPKNKELHVQTEALSHLGAVQAEPTQLGWVWKNLFENALCAMAGKGNLLVYAQSTPQHVSVFVEDSGPGIEEPLRARLFEPFVSSRTDRTGLGLALAKTIVERHGGHISFQKSRWNGSCFIVRLQRASPS